jgi:hypothetical protein
MILYMEIEPHLSLVVFCTITRIWIKLKTGVSSVVGRSDLKRCMIDFKNGRAKRRAGPIRTAHKRTQEQRNWFLPAAGHSSGNILQVDARTLTCIEALMASYASSIV